MAPALREAYVTFEVTSQFNSCDSQLRPRIHQPRANPLNPKVHMYKSLALPCLPFCCWPLVLRFFLPWPV